MISFDQLDAQGENSDRTKSVVWAMNWSVVAWQSSEQRNGDGREEARSLVWSDRTIGRVLALWLASCLLRLSQFLPTWVILTRVLQACLCITFTTVLKKWHITTGSLYDLGWHLDQAYGFSGAVSYFIQVPGVHHSRLGTLVMTGSAMATWNRHHIIFILWPLSDLNNVLLFKNMISNVPSQLGPCLLNTLMQLQRFTDA